MSSAISPSGDALTGETVTVSITGSFTFPVTTNMYLEGSTHDEIKQSELDAFDADPMGYLDMLVKTGTVTATVTVVETVPARV